MHARLCKAFVILPSRGVATSKDSSEDVRDRRYSTVLSAPGRAGLVAESGQDTGNVGRSRTRCGAVKRPAVAGLVTDGLLEVGWDLVMVDEDGDDFGGGYCTYR